MFRKVVTCMLVVLGMSVFLPCAGFAEEKATPQEVYDMVLKAAQMVEQLGDEGINALSNSKEFIWKDSYVSAVNCEARKVVGHPNPKYVGADFGKLLDKNKDESKRKLFLVELCEGAKNPYGVWGEYYWEKLGSTEPARKISFMVQVPGQPYQITSGIYDDQTTLEELNGTVNK